MSATLRYNGRLPGVTVNTALPPQEAPLRLDVAGFVGFAERGPLDTPVALEDAGQYETVFGGDLAVAREAGRPVYAALPAAVRAFFDNGGRRCYVVRVAGAARRAARLAVPGLAAIGASSAAPAIVEAAWAGRWSDQLALWTQLLARPLRLVPELMDTPVACAGRMLVLDLPAAGAVAPGDLLRLSFGADGPLAFFSVQSVQALRRPSSTGLGVPVAVCGTIAAPGAFRRAVAAIPAVTAVERQGTTIADAGSAMLAAQAASYVLSLPSGVAVRAGDLLRISCEGDVALLFPVARVGRMGAVCDDPLWITGEATPDVQPAAVELLRWALRIRLGATIRERFDELRFGPGADDWTQNLCAWADLSDAGPPDLPAGRSALLRLPGDAIDRAYLPVGMPALPAADAFGGPIAAGDDGLGSFEPEAIFLDARLSGFGLRTLIPEAERLLYLSSQTTHLRALHSLIAVAEVALISIPDLAQRGWPATTLAPPIDPPPPPPPAPPPPDWSHFRDCAQPAPDAVPADAVVREFYGYVLPLTAGDTSPGLDASARALLSDSYRAQIADIALPAVLGADEAATGASASLPPCATEGETATTVLGVLTLANGVELRTDFGMVRRGDSWAIDAITSRLAPNTPSETQRRLAELPLLRPRAEYQAGDLVKVQAALITLCAARADMTAALSLPDFFGQRETADWHARLQGTIGLPTGTVLSYAAAYHPWLQQRETATPELAPLRAVPPDGAVCGMIAARENERGVWIAPAGVALRGAVGLTPALTDDDAGTLFDAPAQINVVRRLPGRYVALSAHTLSDERSSWHLGVRRLMILLRKVALRRGAQYVFETNDERFRQQVRTGFERLLSRLAQQGALAAYQVVADDSLNTPNDRDNGRFLVELKIAPVAPIEFITVILLRSSENVLDVIER